MGCRYICSDCFSNMAGSLTIIGIELAIREMVASWTSMTVSHRSIKAHIVDCCGNGSKALLQEACTVPYVRRLVFWRLMVLRRYPKIMHLSGWRSSCSCLARPVNAFISQYMSILALDQCCAVFDNHLRDFHK